jgi:peptidoglycan/xylan/chitin deacetylase (PgdA/CDA1 family)
MRSVFNTIVTLQSAIKGLPQDIAAITGSAGSYFRSARGQRILVYHGICRKAPHRFNTLFITAKTFEAQLRLFKKYCNLISLEDYFAGNFSNDRFNLCLSFDDGFANNYTYVLPLLEKYRIPAVFFITGARYAGYDILWNDALCAAYRYGPRGFLFEDQLYQKGKDLRYIASGNLLATILRRRNFADKAAVMDRLKQYNKKEEEEYWLQMSTAQIKKLARCEWATIGCHSLQHDDLATMPVEELRNDLSVSRQWLEQLTGQPVKALAFPYGSYTGQTLAIAGEAGFSQLLAERYLSADDKNAEALRDRMTINPFINPVNQLYAAIRGKY